MIEKGIISNHHLFVIRTVTALLFVLSFLSPLFVPAPVHAADIKSAGSGNWSAEAWPDTTRNGKITTYTYLTAVTGIDTHFTTEISVGNIVKTQSNEEIGKVASITNDTHLILAENAASTNTDIAYHVQGVGSGDSVTIRGGHTVTVDVPDAACNSLTIDYATGTYVALTISGTNTLTVTNEVTINGPNNDGTRTFAVGDGTLNAGSISFPNANSSRIAELTVSTGTINVKGNISVGATVNPTANKITFSGAGTLNLGGNLSSNLTFTPSDSTVNCNGSTAQTIGGAFTYNTLKANNAAGVTLGGPSTATMLTIGDNSTNSVFSDGGNQLTCTGTLNLTSGTFKLGGAAATTWPNFTTCNIAAGTTVEYASAVAQAVSTAPSYSNLTLSGASAKTPGGV